MRQDARKQICNPFDKVKGLMRELRLNQREVARELNINLVTLNQKLNGMSSFTLVEIIKLIDILGIAKEEIVDYFFADVIPSIHPQKKQEG